VPDGSRVKEGERICELDSSPLKDRLVNQTITTRAAEAAYQEARLAREVAEIALTEYVEGTLEGERRTLKTTIASAESAVRAETVRLERIRDVRKRVKEALAGNGGAATPADMVAELDIEDRLGSAERALERERRALERAKARQEVLEKSTSKKRSAELKGEVEHRRSDERPLPNLRPGMVAQVEILVPELENVLSVPFKAALWYENKHHLAVKKPDGGFEWREVTIAHSDRTIAVTGQGLKSGDVVALGPLALWSEAEKRRKFGRPSNEE